MLNTFLLFSIKAY